MNSDIISFQEVMTILKRHRFSSIIIILLFTAIAVGISFVLPKSFTTKAVLNIPSSYFRIPLVADLVAGTNDTSELRAERDALLRYALNNDFLDKLGYKYKLFKHPYEDRLHAAERDELLAKIQYVNMGSNNYQISMNGSSAEQTYELTQAILDQMILTLIAERLAKLTIAQTAIRSNLETLTLESEASERGALASAHRVHNSLKMEKAILVSLERRFTSRHPTVVRQRRKVEYLKALHLERELDSANPDLDDHSDYEPKTAKNAGDNKNDNPEDKSVGRPGDKLEDRPGDVSEDKKDDNLNSNKDDAIVEHDSVLSGRHGGKSANLSVSQKAMQDIYDDLLRKYDYLNIVIAMEKPSHEYPYLSVLEHPSIPVTATFPKKRFFALGGAAGGSVFALFLMILLELRRGTFTSPLNAARVLETTLLGELPSWQRSRNSSSGVK